MNDFLNNVPDRAVNFILDKKNFLLGDLSGARCQEILDRRTRSEISQDEIFQWSLRSATKASFCVRNS